MKNDCYSVLNNKNQTNMTKYDLSRVDRSYRVDLDTARKIVDKLMNKKTKKRWIKCDSTMSEREKRAVLELRAQKILGTILIKWNNKTKWMSGSFTIDHHLDALYKEDEKKCNCFAYLFPRETKNKKDTTFEDMCDSVREYMIHKELPSKYYNAIDELVSCTDQLIFEKSITKKEIVKHVIDRLSKTSIFESSDARNLMKACMILARYTTGVFSVDKSLQTLFEEK